MKNKHGRYIKTNKQSIEDIMNFELEPKVKKNADLKLKIEEIEKRIFEEIRGIIDNFEKNVKPNKTKEKIIAKLKSKT